MKKLENSFFSRLQRFVLTCCATLLCAGILHAQESTGPYFKLKWEIKSPEFNADGSLISLPVVPLGNNEIGVYYNPDPSKTITLDDFKVYRYDALTGESKGEPTPIVFNESLQEYFTGKTSRVMHRMLGNMTTDDNGRKIIIPLNESSRLTFNNEYPIVTLLDDKMQVVKTYKVKIIGSNIAGEDPIWKDKVERIASIAIVGDCEAGNFKAYIIGNRELTGANFYGRLWTITFKDGIFESLDNTVFPHEDMGYTANKVADDINIMPETHFIKATDSEIICQIAYIKEYDNALAKTSKYILGQFHLKLVNGKWTCIGSETGSEQKDVDDKSFEQIGAKAFEMNGKQYIVRTTKHDATSTDVAIYSYEDTPYSNTRAASAGPLFTYSFKGAMKGAHSNIHVTNIAVEKVNSSLNRIYITTPERGMMAVEMSDYDPSTALTDVVEATQKYRLENGKITTERPAAISVTSIDGTTVVSSPSADAIDITGIAHGFYILTIDGHSSKIRL
jgi:hypothetical protein